MTYTVLWSPEAAAELIALVEAAAAPDPIVRAATLADQQLRTDADRVGESRPNGARVTYQPPLGLLFEVRWRERLVRIIHVWQFRGADGGP